MINDRVKLEKRIERLKKELNLTVKATELDSQETLSYSQQLNQLIITNQKLTRDCYLNMNGGKTS
ncbi:MAG TPA: aspartyl-phosphate phosphatase Spo0E family protein [Bacillus bacterium]|nr:aspartyl-phosphate phosphatase Spo0E family protein [Bacillus sp. (in: firmicutes)]